MPLPASGPNAEQIRYWNEQAGPSWVAVREALDRQIGDLGRIAMDCAAVEAGERVLDVGCGCGDTTLELAARVVGGGRVLGVDISEPMLEEAKARAAQAPPSGRVEFVLADAQTHAFEPAAFDLLFSRFGVMFFADPRAAFANLGKALRPGGRTAFACWKPLAANPWLRLPLETVGRHIPLPPAGDPHAPGPFALGDAARTLGLLEEAGFEPAEALGIDETIRLGGGGSLERTAEFMLQMGPAGQALRLAGESDPAVLAKVKADVVSVLEPYARPEGVIMDCALWVFRAQQPV